MKDEEVDVFTHSSRHLLCRSDPRTSKAPIEADELLTRTRCHGVVPIDKEFESTSMPDDMSVAWWTRLSRVV